MTNRDLAEKAIKDLHAARVAGDVAAMCRLFAPDGRFEIAGASATSPIAIRVEGIAAFRPWLSMMSKVFRLRDYALLALIVEWPRATAHWQASIYSKVTGVTVRTELVDLVGLHGSLIQTYTEFFVPR